MEKSLVKGDSKDTGRQKERYKTGRGIEGFLDSPESLNRGGDISENPPLPRRDLHCQILVCLNDA